MGLTTGVFTNSASSRPQLLQALAKLCGLVEAAGRWPPALSITLTAPTPKEVARAEAELRPTGLTPIIYRVWMCVRKRHTQKWTQALYGQRALSPTDHGWNTRVDQELARFTKSHVLCSLPGLLQVL